jgi:acyl-homoserine-lactone acylase
MSSSSSADSDEPKVRVAGHIPGRDAPVGFGDAWILVVDFSRPGHAWSVLAYGQTTNPQSPHSSDQLQIFANHKLRRAWYSEADIKTNLLREYRPWPYNEHFP